MARRRRNPEIIAGRVNADGSIATGDGFMVSKAGTGLYLVTFAPGFRIVSLVAMSTSASAVVIAQLQASGSWQIAVSSTAGTFTASDQPTSFIAAGVQQ